MPKSRISKWRKAVLGHPCGCYYCCGSVNDYYKKRKLKTPKHKPTLQSWKNEELN